MVSLEFSPLPARHWELGLVGVRQSLKACGLSRSLLLLNKASILFNKRKTY